MYRSCLLVFALLLAAGCASPNPAGAPPTVLRDVDFTYDTIWQASMGAVQMFFPYLELCNKEEKTISSYFKQETNVNPASAYDYAKRAFLEIAPRETREGTKYDISVWVGKYWRTKHVDNEPNKGWELIRWDREIEDKIIKAFKAQTVIEQRVKQGHEKFKKRRRSGW